MIYTQELRKLGGTDGLPIRNSVQLQSTQISSKIGPYFSLTYHEVQRSVVGLVYWHLTATNNHTRPVLLALFCHLQSMACSIQITSVSQNGFCTTPIASMFQAGQGRRREKQKDACRLSQRFTFIFLGKITSNNFTFTSSLFAQAESYGNVYRQDVSTSAQILRVYLFRHTFPHS